MIDFRKFNHIISLTTYFNSEEKCKQSSKADGLMVMLFVLIVENTIA